MNGKESHGSSFEKQRSGLAGIGFQDLYQDNHPFPFEHIYLVASWWMSWQNESDCPR
ncbi:hypothetical protein LFML04_2518 [Leptospirillum ferriphilum ML-04]|uniref:Uncharacterized protein n=1 Tax=Leptospirillum ferriphilum (strain ML-04) TaxID=1048260 RepID=J9ZEY6_LEPFM|nr:hypothetical protein LFML04_2518 [Leptospirillum ferriphilum ML-04]